MKTPEIDDKTKRILDLCAKLVFVLTGYGCVKSIGGSVFYGEGKPLMNTTDMCVVVRKLLSMGIRVSRVDSGGEPTWVMEKRA